MLHRIAIVTDTNSGISSKQANAQSIFLIPMPVMVDGATYFEGVSISK